MLATKTKIVVIDSVVFFIVIIFVYSFYALFLFLCLIKTLTYFLHPFSTMQIVRKKEVSIVNRWMFWMKLLMYLVVSITFFQRQHNDGDDIHGKRQWLKV